MPLLTATLTPLADAASCVRVTSNLAIGHGIDPAEAKINGGPQQHCSTQQRGKTYMNRDNVLMTPQAWKAWLKSALEG